MLILLRNTIRYLRWPAAAFEWADMTMPTFGGGTGGCGNNSTHMLHWLLQFCLRHTIDRFTG